MASALFIVSLVTLVLTTVAVSLREQPLVSLQRHRWTGAHTRVDPRTLLLGVILVFDVVAVSLLARFGTEWS